MRRHFEPGDRSEQQLRVRPRRRVRGIRKAPAIDINFVGTWGRTDGREETESGSDEVELDCCALDIGGMI